MGLQKFLTQNEDCKVALYGLGTETERFLSKYKKELSIVGILDGFRENGVIYGYPILSIQEAIEEGVKLVIVIARPGSCKAITRRIGAICMEKNVALFDVRGKDLLSTSQTRYDFTTAQGETKDALLEKIRKAEVVSFDLFNTLVMRKVYSYTDIFELMDIELKGRGIVIPDFARRRLSAEKELSKDYAPTIEDIYRELLRGIGGSFISAEELSDLEWKIDFSTMLRRDAVYEVYQKAVASGKKVIFITDSYYSLDRIAKLLSEFSIDGYESVFVSCDNGTSKMLKLYDVVISQYDAKSLLHIGDDEVADISEAKKRGIETYRVFSGMDLFDALGGVGTEELVNSLSDRLKCGLFISHLFNNPFWFETDERKVCVSSAEDIGFLFCGAMVADFTLWMKARIKEEDVKQILFCARDGYLLGKLYRMADNKTKSIYFLTSRAAAIRAGVEDDDDIDYVESMKYFGSPEDALKTRFGIEMSNIKEESRRRSILEKAEVQRKNYRKYMEKVRITDKKLAMFDFVAKGTTQMYLERVFDLKMKGFYFLQLEPEFMANKGLEIEPFYSDEEKNNSAIFDNYYILETMLTSPYPQVVEFDQNGNPVFAGETRSDRNIHCLEQMQKGIVEYFEDYISLLPEEARKENKKLDELFLSLVNKIEITDEEFLSLTVEDAFFGRMTDIRELIG